MSQKFTFDILKSAISSNAAAFRRIVELHPVGGPGSKVFPPTYEGGKYATEKRRINGQTIDCVLLDSVQSQANRMEAALQDACDAGLIKLPIITVDFTNTSASFVGKISSLQAPHRIVDAILRDSLLNGVAFRKSTIGKLLDTVNIQDVTALFQYCPTALIFGMWDSAGARGGLGAKFARSIVSEIIGIGVIPGQRTSSRIDPLQINTTAVVYKRGENDWTADEELSDRDLNGNPIKYGKKSDGKPSNINHGNVVPSLVVQKDKNGNPIDKNGVISKKSDDHIPIGGFTIDRAEQITTLSLPAIRRLKFAKIDNHDVSSVAHTVLVALGLCAATLASDQGYDLRSQCGLYTNKPLLWEMLGGVGGSFELDAKLAQDLYEQARIAAIEVGLPFESNPITLQPRNDLVQLVVRSYATEDSDDAGDDD